MATKSIKQIYGVKELNPNQKLFSKSKRSTTINNVIDLKSFGAIKKKIKKEGLNHMSPPIYGLTMGAYSPLYHSDCVNHCPGCGKTHWWVGRGTAECAFCKTALPLAARMEQSNAPRFTVRSSKTAEMTQRTQ